MRLVRTRGREGCRYLSGSGHELRAEEAVVAGVEVDVARAQRSRVRRAERVRDVLVQLWGDELPPGPDPLLTLVLDALAVDDSAGASDQVIVQEDGLTLEAVRLLLERSRSPLTRGVVPRELLWRLFAASGGVSRSEREDRRHFVVPRSAGGWELDVTTGSMSWDRRSAELLDRVTSRHSRVADELRLIHPDDQPEVSSNLEPAGECEPFETTFRIRGSGGDWRRLTSVGRPVTSVDGWVRIVGFLSS